MAVGVLAALSIGLSRRSGTKEAIYDASDRTALLHPDLPETVWFYEVDRAKGVTLHTLASVLRKDPDYGQTTRRLAELDNQMSGLRQTMGSLDDAIRRLHSASGHLPHRKPARALDPVRRDRCH